MNKQKRFFLIGVSYVMFGTVAEWLGASTWGASQQSKFPVPPAASDPSAASPQNSPSAPFPGPNIDPRVSSKQILEHNESQIHEDVEKLYFLAASLKAEVEKTDSQNVLSLSMVQKCEQIEKLAKQMKNLTKAE